MIHNNLQWGYIFDTFAHVFQLPVWGSYISYANCSLAFFNFAIRDKTCLNCTSYTLRWTTTFNLKGVFTKNKWGFRLTSKKKFDGDCYLSLLYLLRLWGENWSKLLIPKNVASIQIQKVLKFNSVRKKINLGGQSFKRINESFCGQC